MSTQKFIKVLNRGADTYTHGEYVLKPGALLDVPEAVANIWFTITSFGQPTVIKASDAPVEVATDDALKAENTKLLSERDALLKRIENLEKLAVLAGSKAPAKTGKAVDPLA